MDEFKFIRMNWIIMDEFKFKTDAEVEDDFSYRVKNSYLPLLIIIMVIIIVTVTSITDLVL